MSQALSFDHVLAFAQDLIRIPGPPGGEGDVAARVRHEMQKLGYDEVRTDELGNVIGRVAGKGGAPAVMLCSHLDVVDVGDPGGWEYPPFGGRVAGGYLHGRGAMDIKGPLALQTYAAAHFLGDRLEGDVLVVLTVLEERGGWGMSHYLENMGEKPGAIILGEATGGDICIGHRGRAEVLVEIRGVAGHASAPERARNPLYALDQVMPALHEFADALPAHPVLGRATLAPTAVETLPRSKNVIPDRVRITLDWRILPGLTAEEAVDNVDAFLRSRTQLPEGIELEVRIATEAQRTYTGLERERRLFTPGFLFSPDHPIVRAAVAAVQGETGRGPAVRPWTFATDGGHSCGRYGIPTLGFAPGEERFAHTNRERLDLEDARRAYAAYPPLIRAIEAAL